MALINNGQENGLYTYDSFGESRKPSDKKFLWWCAGAHQDLLKQFPSEHTKYSGLGGVLLATFALASISAGYAVYTVFNNFIWAILFAVVWGLIIFNFDRFLVSTMRKYGISKRKQLWMSVPRMALALLIGFTIARPLELKIFEKEINVKMAENLHKKIEHNDSLLAIENNSSINNATVERQRLTDRKLAIENQLRNLQSAYVQEADGTGGSEHMEQKRKDYETSAAANMGFLERNKALSDLSGEESSVFWSCLLISLLIILIEIGPVLSKLIMPIGPFDIALAKEELLQMASDENHIRADKEVLHQKKKAFYKKQKEMSDQLVDRLTEIQKKNIDKELDQWERGEWEPGDHRASMDEVMRKIKEQYQFKDDNIL